MNGLLIQWGLHKTKTNVHEIPLDVSYSNTDYVIMAMGQATSEYANANVYGYAVSPNQIKLDTSQSKWAVYMYWFTIGY